MRLPCIRKLRCGMIEAGKVGVHPMDGVRFSGRMRPQPILWVALCWVLETLMFLCSFNLFRVPK